MYETKVPWARTKLITMPFVDLCNGDKNSRIKFSVRTCFKESELHSLVTTIAELESGRINFEAGNGCLITFDMFKLRHRPRFIDYLSSGWQIDLTIAIDYTASNKEIYEPGSLHANGPDN